jgi:hypothetical protein
MLTCGNCEEVTGYESMASNMSRNRRRDSRIKRTPSLRVAASGQDALSPGTPNWRRLSWIFFIVIVAGLALVFLIISSSLPRKLTAEDNLILGQYEAIRVALAHDDLPLARKAASGMAERFSERPVRTAAQSLTASDSLESARWSFKTLSAAAVKIAKGNGGYYVMHCVVPCPEDCRQCPMERFGEWVQMSPTVENPFMGKASIRCGKIKIAGTR